MYFLIKYWSFIDDKYIYIIVNSNYDMLKICNAHIEAEVFMNRANKLFKLRNIKYE